MPGKRRRARGLLSPVADEFARVASRRPREGSRSGSRSPHWGWHNADLTFEPVHGARDTRTPQISGACRIRAEHCKLKF